MKKFSLRPLWFIVGLGITLLLPPFVHAADGDFTWARQLYCPGFNEIVDVAVDSNKNVIVVGNYGGSLTLGGTVLTATGNTLNIFVAKYNEVGLLQWAKSWSGSSSLQTVRRVATDASGNVVIVGDFISSTNLGGTNLTATGTNNHLFIAKYDSSTGNHLWSGKFSGSGLEIPHGMDVDSSGNIYVLGDFNGAVTFGATTLTNVGDNSVFLLKLSPTGTSTWAKKVGGATGDYSYDLAANGIGDMAITGIALEPTVDFGNGISVAGGDLFIAKYNTAGTCTWAKRPANAGSPGQTGVALDTNGNVAVVGDFSAPIDFGNGPLTFNGMALDIFVAKYNSAGTIQWSKSYGSTSNEQASGVSLDGNGNVIVTGRYEASFTFGGFPLSYHPGVNTSDIFLAKLASTTGLPLWAKGYGSALDDKGVRVQTDSNNNIVTVGMTEGTIDFNGGSLTNFSPYSYVLRLNGGGSNGNGFPPAPSNLTVVSSYPNELDLKWTDNTIDYSVSNAWGFEIETGPSSSGPWTKIGNTGYKATFFPHTNLTPGTNHFYRVKAFNIQSNTENAENVYSAYSPVANGTTLAAVTIPATSATRLLVFTYPASTGAPIPSGALDFFCNNSGPAIADGSGTTGLVLAMDTWMSREANKYQKPKPYNVTNCLRTQQVALPDSVFTGSPSGPYVLNTAAVMSYLENTSAIKATVVAARYVTVFHYFPSLAADMIAENAEAVGTKYSFAYFFPMTQPASAATQFDPPLFIDQGFWGQSMNHEFMHNLGGTDKYTASGLPACVNDPTTGQPYNGYDIMCAQVPDTASNGAGPVPFSQLLVTDGTAREVGWTGAAIPLPHPADIDRNFQISQSEMTTYGACWKTPNCVSANPPNPIPIGYVTVLGPLWKAINSAYHYDSTQTCPQCWTVGP